MIYYLDLYYYVRLLIKNYKYFRLRQNWKTIVFIKDDFFYGGHFKILVPSVIRRDGNNKWNPLFCLSPKHYYWLYSPLYISSLWLVYFVNGSVYLLISFTCFPHLLHPSPFWQPIFVLGLYDPFLFYVCSLFCISVFTWPKLKHSSF